MIRVSPGFVSHAENIARGSNDDGCNFNNNNINNNNSPNNISIVDKS